MAAGPCSHLRTADASEPTLLSDDELSALLAGEMGTLEITPRTLLCSLLRMQPRWVISAMTIAKETTVLLFESRDHHCVLTAYMLCWQDRGGLAKDRVCQGRPPPAGSDGCAEREGCRSIHGCAEALKLCIQRAEEVQCSPFWLPCRHCHCVLAMHHQHMSHRTAM